MRLLFCCEFYHPSVGGVQEVMRQIAERMVQRGHEVTVATTRLRNRDFEELNGVRIESFSIVGNLVTEIEGEIERYRRFVVEFPADAVLIKAAQQWTFDALWPVLDDIPARKIFIPCGLSGLYDDSYAGYFRDLPPILEKFDHLIFYAERYRDIDFARAHGLSRFSIVPNGASEVEFGDRAETTALRERLGIPADSFVFSTVGGLTNLKGHREVEEAFSRLDTGGRKATLVLNGNHPIPPDLESSIRSGRPKSSLGRRIRQVIRREGISGLTARLQARLARAFSKRVSSLALWSRQSLSNAPKQVLRTDLPRQDVVALFQATDLFVFASNIEYSPLVLYESAAAGTPFLTVPVGNAAEIARWTGGGLICPAPEDARHYTRVDPKVLARFMEQAMNDPETLTRLGRSARTRWEKHFSWQTIADRYESILAGKPPPPADFLAAPETAQPAPRPAAGP